MIEAFENNLDGWTSLFSEHPWPTDYSYKHKACNPESDEKKCNAREAKRTQQAIHVSDF